MKPAKCLVVSLLFALPALSQTALQTNSDSESILAARSQYSQSDAEPGHQKDGNTVDVPLAQVSRGRALHPPMRPPQMTEYPGAYASVYTGERSGRHAVIGALIGFGLGAALGAKGNTDQHPGAGVKAAFVFGGIGALIGAAVGSATPSFQSPRRHRRGRWPEEDEDASLRHGRKPTHIASARPAQTSLERELLGRTSPEKGVSTTLSASSFQEPEPARPASEP